MNTSNESTTQTSLLILDPLCDFVYIWNHLRCTCPNKHAQQVPKTAPLNKSWNRFGLSIVAAHAIRGGFKFIWALILRWVGMFITDWKWFRGLFGHVQWGCFRVYLGMCFMTRRSRHPRSSCRSCPTQFCTLYIFDQKLLSFITRRSRSPRSSRQSYPT